MLDTTGFVWGWVAAHGKRKGYAGPNRIGWSDLSPFQKGYIEAMFSSAVAPQTMWPCRFQDLAPETLVRILSECKERSESLGSPFKTEWLGQNFWECRQRNEFEGGSYDFPPLTVTLGDDGKIRFA